MHPSSSSEASSRTKKLGSHSLLRGPDRTPTPKSILCFQKDAVVTAHSYPIYIQLGRGGNRTLRSHAHARALTLRTKWIKTVKGGVSNLTRRILRDAFCGEKSVAIAGVGIPPTSNAEVIQMVKIFFAAIIGDEEALNAMCFSKGASGVLPCLSCSAVNKPLETDKAKGIKPLSDRDAAIVDISCPDISLVGLRSDADIWDICDGLEEASPNKEFLKELEHVTGVKFDIDTLLFDRELRRFVGPASSVTSDPLHILFSNGLLGAEMMLFLNWLKTAYPKGPSGKEAYFNELRSVGEDWHPKTLIFNESREKSSKDSATLKAGASELLSGYPLMRRFILDTFGADSPELQVRSILLLFQICDGFRLLNKHLPDAEQEVVRNHLRTVVREYLVAFKAAYGIEHVRFKHHQLLHWLEQFPQLSCFCMERKHITAKQCMVNTTKFQHIAKGSLIRMMNHQVRKLEDPGWGSGLGQSTREFPEMAASLGAANVLISSSMRWEGITLKHRDIVFLDPAQTFLIIIVACLGIDDKFGLVIRSCQHISGTHSASIWQVAPELAILHLVDESVFHVAFWRYLSSDHIEVLH